MSLIDNQAMQYILGNRPDLAQRMVAKDTRNLVNLIPGVSSRQAVNVGRFAGRVAPALSAFQNVADVADLVTGEESIANKGMDVAAMGVGGAAGFALGGPLGAAQGSSSQSSANNSSLREPRVLRRPCRGRPSDWRSGDRRRFRPNMASSRPLTHRSSSCRSS